MLDGFDLDINFWIFKKIAKSLDEAHVSNFFAEVSSD